MKIGWSLPTMLGDLDRDTVLTWSREIERRGYDTIGFGERIAYRNLELFTVLSAAAAVTERVRIMSTIVVLPMHSEVWVAKQSATLDVVSGGRYTLGVGVGGREEDYRALGRDASRRPIRLDAQVATMRRVWAGHPPVEGVDPVGPMPVQTPIPILSGALGPKATARAAAWADGIAGFEMDPTVEALTASATRVRDAWAQAGRDEPYLMTSFWFALGDDAEAALRAYARSYLAVFGDELADALAAACTVAGERRLLEAIEAAAACGYDEAQLVPTTADPTVLDRVDALLAGSALARRQA